MESTTGTLLFLVIGAALIMIGYEIYVWTQRQVHDGKTVGAKDCTYEIQWSPCSAPCGVGTRTQRLVVTQVAEPGGNPCPPPPPNLKTEQCMVKSCVTEPVVVEKGSDVIFGGGTNRRQGFFDGGAIGQ